MANKTAFPLGVFVGGPNGSDAGVLSTVTNQFNSFTSLMGAAPEFMNAYVDQGQSIASWPSNASWTAWSWTQMPGASAVVPMIGLPMANSWDAGHPDSAFKALASGADDSALRGIVKSWADHGFMEQVWRPGYEMNVQSMPWYVGSDKQTQQDYVSAFQHIAGVLRSAGSDLGVDVKIVWSPNIQNWNGDIDVMSLYPGNAAVDIIGPDQYDNMYPRDLYDWAKNDGSYASSFQEWASNPVNVQHYFDHPSGSYWHPTGDGQGNGQSLQDFIDLAKATGKTIALSETGAGGGGNTDTWEDPSFVQWLANKLESSGVPVSYVSMWDVNDNGAWDFSSAGAGKPQTAAAWREYFGAGSNNSSTGNAAVNTPAVQPVPAAAPGTTSLGSGPDTIHVGLSEDAYQGNAQAIITIDGQTIGGTQTITASHAAGQSQDFAIAGNWGTSAHTIGIRFINDAYDGSSSADRNLYVDSASLNGRSAVPGSVAMMSNGQSVLSLPPGTAFATSGNNLVLHLAENAYGGDAQFTVAVDGQQQGGTLTATASQANGAWQDIDLGSSFAPGAHDVAVTFLNDRYDAGGDRNLFVGGASYGGAQLSGATASLYSAGTSHLALYLPG